MRSYYRFLVLAALFVTTPASAISVFAKPLLWRATNSIDWVLTDTRGSGSQEISYHTISFDFDPGLTLGATSSGDVSTEFYFTSFHTNSKASASGRLTPAFLGGKLSNGTYTSGNIDYDIDYKMFDLAFIKKFSFSNGLVLAPILGLKGGRINQDIDTNLNGSILTTEKMKNDFKGIGPKFGINIEWTGWSNKDSNMNLNAILSTAYLFGNWDITDKLVYNSPSSGNPIDIDTGSHNFGSLMFSAVVGASYQYKAFRISLNYEIHDWFDQTQIFDDASGGHNNDLILQGISLGLNWDFA